MASSATDQATADKLQETISISNEVETQRMISKSLEKKESEEEYAAGILRRTSQQKGKATARSSRANSVNGKNQPVQSEVISWISDINNPEWRTPGDRELRKITLPDGLEETLYFAPSKFHHKKVFMSFTIDNIEVDAARETFRAKFFLQFNWIPSEADYRSLYKAATDAYKYRRPDLLSRWQPAWKPIISFENAVDIHAMDWRPHPKIPEKGPFRLAQYKKWEASMDGNMNAIYREQDFDRIKWICAELECDVTFREELELPSYPFDVQDLSMCFHFDNCDNIDYSIFGLPNYFNADASVNGGGDFKHPSLVGRIDPSSSQLDEWDVDNCLMEFSFTRNVLSVKLSRRWRPILINTVFIMFLMQLVSFTVFAVEPQDVASRLELIMTLILTAVLFDTQSSPKPYLTFLDKYILSAYGYLCAVMIENAICGFESVIDAEQFDFLAFWFILALFLFQHVAFIWYAFTVRKRETAKISMGYEEVKEYNQRQQIQTKKLFLYDDRAAEHGVNKYRKRLCIPSCDAEKQINDR